MTEKELRNGLARELTKVVRLYVEEISRGFKPKHPLSYCVGDVHWQASAAGTDLADPIATKLHLWWYHGEGWEHKKKHYDTISPRMAWEIPLIAIYVDGDGTWEPPEIGDGTWNRVYRDRNTWVNQVVDNLDDPNEDSPE